MDLHFELPLKRSRDKPPSTSAYVSYSLGEGFSTSEGESRLEELGQASIRLCISNKTSVTSAWEQVFAKLRQLKPGWNGYNAPPPSDKAIGIARSFLESLLRADFEPNRVAPSAVGGVGITRRYKNRSVYVEFYNDGRALVLFSDDESDPVVKPIEASLRAFKLLVSEIRGYLNA